VIAYFIDPLLRKQAPSNGAPAPDPKPPAGPVLTVAHDGTADHRTLAAALAAAPAGATIKIKPGEYEEAVTLDKNVLLEGDGARSAVVVRGVDAPALTVAAPGAAARGLTLQARKGPAADGAPAVRLTADGRLEDCELRSDAVAAAVVEGDRVRPTLKGCAFREGPVGLLIQKGAAPQLDGCSFPGGTGQGVVVEQGRGSLKGCTFGKGKEKKALVEVQDRGELELSNCRMERGQDVGLYVHGGVARLLDCVVAENEESGVWVEAGGAVELKGGEVRKNKGYGVRARERSQVSLIDCKVVENGVAPPLNLDPDCRLSDGPLPSRRGGP
jgi:hypothetical protein